MYTKSVAAAGCAGFVPAYLPTNDMWLAFFTRVSFYCASPMMVCEESFQKKGIFVVVADFDTCGKAASQGARIVYIPVHTWRVSGDRAASA